MGVKTSIGVLLFCHGLSLGATAAVGSGPVALAVHGPDAYVVQGRSGRIQCVDTATQTIARTLALEAPLTGIALSPDGTRLYVTGGGPRGRVYELEAAGGRVLATYPVGHSPCAPVLSRDGRSLFVCNRFDDTVTLLPLATSKTPVVVPVVREPVGAALTPDGSRLFVLNSLPRARADQDYTACAVSVLGIAEGRVLATVALPNGSNQLRGIALSPDGRVAYVTHLLARYQLPTTQVERGWINTNALTVIDTATLQRVSTVLLDDVERGAANPWGVGCSADGRWLCVALAGTHELSIIDRLELHRRLDAAAADADAASSNLAFLAGAKRRIALPGQGPRVLALTGRRALVAAYFSNALIDVDLTDTVGTSIRSLPLAPGTTDASPARQGERLFNDATLCLQHWQSCASCHSSDARVDALNWDLMNDGLGNPKNTKSLLLAHRTPPAMSLGVRASAEVAVRAGLRYILFAVRPEAEAVALDAYLRSLEPVPSPHLVDGALSPAAERGRQVFGTAGCAHCHSGPTFTSGELHDVGTGLGADAARPFDTPTLIELWRTAPYLHDGRAATVRDVLTTANPQDRHGHTAALTPRQLRDLETYLLSL